MAIAGWSEYEYWQALATDYGGVAGNLIERRIADLVRRPAWHTQAACRGAGPDQWFPAPGAAEQLDDARTICATCPAHTQCLQDALPDPSRKGVWGGTSEIERRRLRSARVA